MRTCAVGHRLKAWDFTHPNKGKFKTIGIRISFLQREIHVPAQNEKGVDLSLEKKRVEQKR